MAKAANSSNKVSATSAATSADATSNDFEWADDLPASTRGGGSGAKASDTMNAIKALPAPRTVDGKTQFARKWFPLDVEVPANITDPAEREKAAKDNLRKLTNKLSGITRRILKKDASAAYTLRTMENNGKQGVAVYRTEAKAADAPQPVASGTPAPAAPSA